MSSVLNRDASLKPALSSNSDIADRLSSLRAVDGGRQLVPEDADLTAFPGIGDAITACVREIVTTGTLAKLEKLLASPSHELAGISRYPRLDPKRVLRVY